MNAINGIGSSIDGLAEIHHGTFPRLIDGGTQTDDESDSWEGKEKEEGEAGLGLETGGRVGMVENERYLI